MKDASPRAPRSRPTACARIVLPAPVSPVIAFRPGAKPSSAARMRTRFSIRSLRSKGVVVAAEEGRLRQARQEAAALVEPDGDLPTGWKLAEHVPVDEHSHGDVGRAVGDREVEATRDDERTRAERMGRDE